MQPVFDGHNDTLTRLFTQGQSGIGAFFEKADGQVDLPRARAGDMAGGIFAICTPPPQSSPERNMYYGLKLTCNGYDVKARSKLEQDYAAGFTDSVLDFAYRLEASSQGQVKIIRGYDGLRECVEKNVLAMMVHFEGAEAILPDLGNLESYYSKGLRSLGLVWSRPNAFGCGVPFRHPSTPDIGEGLTSAGMELVHACNDLGIIIDLAHINYKGFFDAAKTSKRPLVVSHAGVHAICPSTRNLTDEQIDAVRDSGGVIGVFFEPVNMNFRMKEDGTPETNTPLSGITRHIDYIAERVGIEHVAIGSDFDGADMPGELKDVSMLPNLISVLKKSGYSDEEIELVAIGNWTRIIQC